jgi:glycosyltransferase involved in cell wall biosynthesis
MDRDFLTQALDSIALQTYANVEVVVVAVRPDHRTLSSHCGAFPLRLVSTDYPVMRSAAANRAIDAARGEYLIFLDDDDWMMPGHVARLTQVLEKFPQTQAVYTGIGLVDAQGRSMGQTFDLPFDPIRQLSGNLTPIHAVLFRSKVRAMDCRFDETLDRLEDWDFWLQLAKLAPLVHLPGVSAVYRIHESSGVHQDAGPTGAASARIYQKWETQWTPQQIGQIMQRVWTYPELEARVAEARAQALFAERALGEGVAASLVQQIAAISRQAVTIEHQAATIEHQAATIEHQAANLVQQQLRAESQLLDLQIVRAQFAQIDSERRAILQSTTWRLTAPLRAVITGLKRVPLRQFLGRLRRLPGILMREGPLGVMTRLRRRPVLAASSQEQAAPNSLYDDWLAWESTNRPLERLRMLADVRSFEGQGIAPPTIAVVMPSYNPPLDLLSAAIESVMGQSWSHWTLHIADDASTNPNVRPALEQWMHRDSRIRVSFADVNGHISRASNLALSTVDAPYFALLDQDDLLAEDALLHMAVQIMRHPSAAIIYSDEDKIDTAGKRSGPYFKPDFNLDLLLGQNTISHLGVYSTALARQVGGFRVGYEGSQDHDLALRCVQHLRPDQVVHIPRVLYHWRVHAGSTAANIDEKPYALVAGVAAVQDHLDRTEPGAKVSLIEGFCHYRVRFPVPKPHPTVTVIVPTRNGLKYLKPCIEGLLHGTDYDAMQVVIVDNGSDDPQTLAQLHVWAQDSRVNIRRDIRPFNFSALNNAAVADVDSEFVLLLNNDISMIHPEWLLEMVSHGLRAGVGAVGAALWYPDGTLQHGGVILGVRGVADHAHKGIQPGNSGYFGRARLLQTLSAVTAACLLVRKSLYLSIGGLNEQNLAVAFNDVDFCIRLTKAGYRTIWTPFAQLYHHESVSRGDDLAPDKVARFQAEVDYMFNTWGEDLLYDPAYNPNLTLTADDFSVSTAPRSWPRKRN